MRRNSLPVGFIAAAGLDHPLDLDVWPHPPSFAALAITFLWCSFKFCDENATYFERQEAHKSVLRNARIACFWGRKHACFWAREGIGTGKNVPLIRQQYVLRYQPGHSTKLTKGQ